MRPIATDVTHNMVSVFSTRVSCAKTKELIKMSFIHWVSDSCGSKEPCIRWGPDHSTGRGTFERRHVNKVSKQCIAVSKQLSFTPTGNSYAIWDHTVLPATWQRWESCLYPQLKQVLDLATRRDAKLSYHADKICLEEWTNKKINEPINASERQPENIMPLPNTVTW